MDKARFSVIEIENPETNEIIIGQGNFTVKTIEDFYDVLVSSSPGIEFGVAMNEAKPKLVRVNGNLQELKDRAAKTCLQLGAGHAFVIYFRKAFPLHVLNAIKSMPTIANIYCATSNPLQLITAETSLGKSITGVVDGTAADKIETPKEKKERLELLEKLGFRKKE
ncbi:MAG: adenosine-specific kinase [Candidatus Diapherotrites archaeon]